MLLVSVYTWAQETPKVEPPFWWTGMKVTELQLMVHAEGIAYTAPRIVYPGVQLTGVSKTDNPDFIFLDLQIGEDAEPGKFRIDFDRDEDVRYTYEYELKERENLSAERSGFGPEEIS